MLHLLLYITHNYYILCFITVIDRYYMDIDMDKLANSLLDEVKYLRPYLEVLLREISQNQKGQFTILYLFNINFLNI